MTRAKLLENVEKAARLQQCIVTYKKKEKKSGKASIRAIARQFKVAPSTLKDRLDGKVARNQAHEHTMHLTRVEETELVQWITSSGAPLSTAARNYAQKVVKQLEWVQARNTIIEQEHEKLRAVATKRKTILSGKKKVIDGKHILTSESILNGLQEAEKQTKKRKMSSTKKAKHRASKVVEDSNDESESSQDEPLVILDCIEVEY
jgi:hypothetical protein